MDIVLATGNPHKVQEMRDIFGRLAGDAAPGVRLLGLKELPPPPGGAFVEPVEDGRSFEENALKKATSYARQTGLMCLADDSGLEIDALGGRPGVISSHYCTDGRESGMSREERDAANNARVLRELEGVRPERRSARFVCVMALCGPAGPYGTVRGTFEGRIGVPPDVPRGENGFGYDPLFLTGPDWKRTSAELSPEVKNRTSHRGAAAQLALELIRKIMAERS